MKNFFMPYISPENSLRWKAVRLCFRMLIILVILVNVQCSRKRNGQTLDSAHGLSPHILIVHVQDEAKVPLSGVKVFILISSEYSSGELRISRPCTTATDVDGDVIFSNLPVGLK